MFCWLAKDRPCTSEVTKLRVSKSVRRGIREEGIREEGIPYLLTSEYENILGGDFHMGLKGCIANLVVNGISIDLKEKTVEGANVNN